MLKIVFYSAWDEHKIVTKKEDIRIWLLSNNLSHNEHGDHVSHMSSILTLTQAHAIMCLVEFLAAL